MSATTNTKYDETEKSWEGTINVYITRTDALEIHVGEESNNEVFRASLVPLFTFMKQQLKGVDWKHISRTRDLKWGYKRLEDGELFEMLGNDKI